MNGRSCLFATFLAGSLQHSSIKVYLSGVRALHIEQGFADPLHNCLRLQRVIRGTQGSPSSSCLPITDDLMLVIWKSLNLQLPDHCMFWVACTLGYFGFLRSAEFTVPSLATSPPPPRPVHLGVQDIAVDSSTAPSCIRVTIKASKTDPFRKGCSIHIGPGKYPLSAVAGRCLLQLSAASFTSR